MEGLNKIPEENKKPQTPIEGELSLEQRVKILEDEKKELENILRISEKKSEILDDKLKNIFKLFKIIGHDLKGPIGNTVVHFDMLKMMIEEDPIDIENIKDYMESMKVSSERTYDLTQNLLAWSDAQFRGERKNFSVMDLNDQVEKAIAVLTSIAEDKRINLENKVENNLNVFADENMLQTVVRNIVSNALKFTQEGGEVSVLSRKDGENIEIKISDNGMGLTKDKIEKLFKTAVVSSEGTRGEKGTGLGLVMCKDMVEKMGGTIRVESEEGKGTTFIVSLPEGKKEVE